jgi:D-serine deaminase-like pyridoxal phosphate-dependent protein
VDHTGRLGLPGILVDWRTRGFLHPGPAIDAGEFAAADHSLFDGSFTWPVMAARRSALEHNVAALAGFAERHGPALASHGKTTMSPALFQAQLDAGAWGISAATAAQVLVHRALGVSRVLLANEILDPAALRRLAGELDGFEFLRAAWFDLVAEEPAPLAQQEGEGLGALVILCSGAYIAHDDGFYHERTPYTRLPAEGLRPALEVWAQVLSVPEPGLALAGMGKRDVPYDLDLPAPRAVRRGGQSGPLDGVTLTRVQDQHAYLTGDWLRPGDLMSFGISHPCTAFDKWRVIPILDHDVVVDVITTCF